MKWYTAVTIGIIVILIGVVVINEVVFSYPKVEEKVVHYGDVVAIYFVAFVKIGDFRYVVDTNMQSVVDDDVAWPKIPNYIKRNTSAPFTTSVGSGDLPLDLELSLIGHRVNDTVVVKLTAQQARRGQKSPEDFVLSPRDMVIPVLQEVSRYYFVELFNEPPAMNKEYVHPLFGWRVKVLPGGGDMVILYHMPEAKEYYPAQGWHIKVVSKTEDYIVVHIDAEPGAMNPQGWVVAKVTPDNLVLDKKPGFGRDVYYIVRIVQVSSS